MIHNDFKCEECGHIFELWKESISADYSKSQLKCPECKSKNVYKKFGKVLTDVCVGSCGNAETGYSDSFTYHPAKFSPAKKR